jgi:hypothetical protein
MSRVTDAQIRELLRAEPTLLDTAMVALHSKDAELRRLARKIFAERRATNRKTP